MDFPENTPCAKRFDICITALPQDGEFGTKLLMNTSMETPTDNFSHAVRRYCRQQGERATFLAAAPASCLQDLTAQMMTMPAFQFTVAVDLVISLQRSRAIPTLFELLETGNPQRAQQLAGAIATVGGCEARQRFLEVLQQPALPEVRQAAVYGLTWLLDEQAFAPLLDIFCKRYEPPELRAQAAEGLTYLVSGIEREGPLWQRAAEAFLAGLEDKDVDVRLRSVYALGTMRVEAALAPLRHLAAIDMAVSTTTEQAVRDEAQDAALLIEQALSVPPNAA